jgi:hypothetical protein
MIDPRYTFNDMADSRPLRVPEGLFVLRYVSSPDGLDAPEISVTVPQGSDIAVVDSADSFVRRGETVLGMPGDAVVLKARREGAVLITVLSPGGRGRRQAHVGLERVTNAPRPSVGTLPHAAPQALDVDPEELLEIMAHVANRGDVTVKGGQWICGPQFPMAIEGIAVNWRQAPQGVDVVTTARVNDRGRTQLAPAPSGRFVGTRGRAAPLVGLSFTLTGPLASRYTLSCEALFLGAAIVSRVGATVDLKGPTGHEPLVGLRLSIVPAVPMTIAAAPLRTTVPQPFYETSHQPYEVAQQPARAMQDPATSSTDDGLPARMGVAGAAGRVRVFRTSRSRTALN